MGGSGPWRDAAGMKRKPVLAAATTALALVLAPSAFAQDYCVADAACVSGGGTPELTLDAAITAADADVAKDRVFLGSGTFPASSTDGYFAIQPVEIIGAGAGSTTITGPTGTDTILQLPAGSRVSDLHIHMPFSSTNLTKYGVDVPNGAQLEHLSITAAPNMPAPAIGAVVGDGSALRASTVSIPIGTNLTTAVQTDAGGVAEDDLLSAGTGVHVLGDNVSVRRSRITANVGVDVRNSATNNELADSLIHVLPKGIGVLADTGNGTDAGISVRGSAIVGDGNLLSRGLDAASSQPHVASISVDSSIIRGVGKSVVLLASQGSANVSIQYSDFDPSTAGISGAGTLTQGAGNVNVDPLFAAPDDQHLLAGSPLIDAGNPADLGDLTDLDGGQRVTDGDGDATARRDIGAFESPAVASVPPSGGDGGGASGGGASGGGASGDTSPVGAATAGAEQPGPAVAAQLSLLDHTAPVITNLRALRGPRLSFRLSEYAVVRVQVFRRENSARLVRAGALTHVFGVGAAKLRLAHVGRNALRPGAYVAKLVATDAARNRSRTYSVKFKILR
jgi:hypothetical protein